MPFPVKLKVLIQDEIVSICLNDSHFETHDSIDEILDWIVETNVGKRVIVPLLKYIFSNIGYFLISSIISLIILGVTSSFHIPISDPLYSVMVLWGIIGFAIFGMIFALKHLDNPTVRMPGTTQVVKIPNPPKDNGIYEMEIIESEDGEFYSCFDYGEDEFNLSHIQYNGGNKVFAKMNRTFSIPKSDIPKKDYNLKFNFTILFPIDLKN